MRWCLIDASWLAYRARHAFGQRLSFADEPTGVVFGFFEQLRVTCYDPRVRTNAVALCFDSRKSYRRNAFPAYKQKRREERTPAEWAEVIAMKEQVERLRRDILPRCGFVCLKQSGLESDDVMAMAATQLPGTGVMVTADNDLYQCINDRVHWYDPVRDLYLDPARLVERKRVGSNEWGLVKCLAGCRGDGVPGIPGIGEKTAIDYIWKILKPGKKLDAIMSPEGLRIMARNERLVVLPHLKTRPVKLPPDGPQYDRRAFYDVCAEYGFKSYLDGPRRRAWDGFFDGAMNANDLMAQRARKRHV